jgi:hypothetical protein
MSSLSEERTKYLRKQTKSVQCNERGKSATNGRERMQQSTGQDARKQTNDVQGPSVVLTPERMIISVATPEHSASTCNQSLWVSDDVAPSAAGAPMVGSISGFVIVAQGLAYEARYRATRFV